MFTGLIEKVANVKKILIDNQGAKLFFEADFANVEIGSSIAINGVCLTMTKVENNLYSADVMKQTLEVTNLKYLKTGDIINLERAMRLSDRLDGHIVTGHVDSVAKVADIVQDGFSKRIRFNSNLDYIIEKGSVAINGVSLTVAKVYSDGFEVSLIPQTIKDTNLSILKVGDSVNIEFDLFAKYIKKFCTQKEEKSSKLTFEFLKENGF